MFFALFHIGRVVRSKDGSQSIMHWVDSEFSSIDFAVFFYNSVKSTVIQYFHTMVMVSIANRVKEWAMGKDRNWKLLKKCLVANVVIRNKIIDYKQANISKCSIKLWLQKQFNNQQTLKDEVRKKLERIKKTVDWFYYWNKLCTKHKINKNLLARNISKLFQNLLHTVNP